MQTAVDVNVGLADDMARMYASPLDFVIYAFPWDSDPSIQLCELEGEYAEDFKCKYGPDRWACEFLDELGAEIEDRGFDGVHAVDPIKMSTVSGHGIGKSTISAWLILFIASTRPHSKGVVTANTSPQLKTKTWAELGKWKQRCITGHWFSYNNGHGNMNLYHNQHPQTWRCDAQTCREQNSESFAGLHAANSTPYYLFDEASAVPDAIWEVAEGGLTDGEPMFFAFGNGTRNSGTFHRSHHGNRHRWLTRCVDSRDVQITNKSLITQWLDDYGEDSDFFKVRVRGKFPSASSLQFIPGDMVTAAQKRNTAYEKHDPIVIGVDTARFGDDETVIRSRVGRNGKVLGPKKLRGANSIKIAQEVVGYMSELSQICGRPVDAVFVDGGGPNGGGTVDQLRAQRVNVIEINFGNTATNKRYRYMMDQMWGNMRDWLKVGCIDDDPELYDDLTAREYGYTLKDTKIALESKQDMKKRGLSSPDNADALALTFAMPVAPKTQDNAAMAPTVAEGADFDPYE